MSSNEQSNTNNLNYNTDVTVFPFNMPTATLATLGIEGATEYTSGKEYHRYIPVLNKDGKLDGSFLKGVQVDISLPPTGPYYFVDSVEGDNNNSGSIQNPFKTLQVAAAKGKVAGITSFVLRSGVFDKEVVDLVGLSEIYIIGDGYGKSTIKNLNLASTDTTTGHTVYLKDVNVETLTIATSEIIDVYLIGSTSLGISGLEEDSISSVTPNSTEFNLHTDVNVTVAPDVYEKVKKRDRIIHSDALQYNETTTLDEKIASIDKNISDLDTDFEAHESNDGNPHKVTTAQIGALPLCGGVMQGCIYYGTESNTRLVDENYVDTTIASDIAVHNTNEDAHSNILCNYAKLTDLDNTSACITSDINAHIDNKDNPHELYLVNIPAMQSDTKNNHLQLKNGSLTILNDIVVPTTFTITSGGITIKDDQTDNFKSTGGGTNTVFRRYPYNRVTRDNAYSNIDANRIYYYFMEEDLEKLISPETGEYIQLSDDWLRGYVYITLNTKDGRDINNTESPWIANRISIVPHPLDGSDFSETITELVGSEHSEVGYAFGGKIEATNTYLNGSSMTLISKIDEGLVNEGTLVLTSRDIDTTGILNCIGEIKDSIDSVDNKTSSLEGELNELTDEFDELKDALIEGGEVTIIATETKSIVSEDKKTTVSISEDNRLEMCVKSTFDGVDTYTSTYFLTESYDANTVTPLIERVDILESKSTEFQNHINNKSNPHNVTAAQIGALTEETEFNDWKNGTAITLGSGAEASDYSTAIGYCAIACGYSSNALGYGAYAGDSSNAIGYCAEAGDSSNALGTGASAYGYYSNAIGNGASACGCYSNALGDSASASGGCSNAIGYCASASGGCSNALGYCAEAGGESSTAIGYCASACGGYSTAIGTAARASEESTALGSGAQASEYYSTALGSGASASGGYSTAIGYCAYAGDYSNAIGAYVYAGDSSNAIGYCAEAGDSSNALGTGASASGTNSNAIGYCASASGCWSNAIGYASASGGCSNAIGYKAYACAGGATQIGSGTNTTANTLQFRSYQLLDAEGKIPVERIELSDTSNGKKYQLTVTNGVLGVTEVTITQPT